MAAREKWFDYTYPGERSDRLTGRVLQTYLTEFFKLRLVLECLASLLVA